MSGFQIPGLGFAKPNETLPPLPPDVLAAAASFEGVSTDTTEQKEDTKMEEAGTIETKPLGTATVSEAGPSVGASNDTKTTEQKPDISMEEFASTETKPAVTTETDANDSAAAGQAAPAGLDAMNIDDDTEHPSLTDALEAMISGLDPTPPVQPVQQPQPTAAPEQEPPTAPQAASTDQPPAEGEHPEWEIDSSPYESSSESSSDSSDSDSEAGDYQLLGVEETARMLMEMEAASDDENDPNGSKAGGGAGGGGHLRTKNEVAAEVIPKPDVTLIPEDKIEELGVVEQIVDNIMVVRAFTPGEYQVLDSGSVLCTEDRKVFGVVWETIGKVLQPMYTVLFTTADEVVEAGLKVGTRVFYPAAHATFVFTQPLKSLKGSDASNIHDEEVGEDEIEFSDDEKEAEYKRSIKQKKKDAKFKNGGGPAKGVREPHPLRNEMSTGPSADGGLNYDDEDDGPYKPLARPPGFGQTQATQQSCGQEPEPGRFGSRRGGRGDFKSRGDRGRGRGRGRGGYGQRGDSRDGYSMPPGQRYQSVQQDPIHQPSQGQWGNNGYQVPQNYNNNNNNNQQQQQSAPAPAAPTFNFPFPPPPGQQGFPAVPPPPPGWPAQNGQSGQNPQGAYINPALFAALLSQMQQSQAQNGQQQVPQSQQQQLPQQPPQPPHQWGAQPPPQ
ncbi:H/ACA ribonucleoprotein complex non-core subunit NAF1 [Colletotrichum chlorophyti]|uniref:H/ACA ribonucleoprotein complex non-core subunit NAF1 n=1 Tax=Colletotrichum chlorophyti TaxID=708187 RepID=A0A1Q8S2Y8_9PEZI|nr:H/ACA ribonucleoprotein complex non-core subunit NAF1 [Colletotrichum chlorophyti]